MSLVGDNDGDMSEIELTVRQQKKLNPIKNVSDNNRTSIVGDFVGESAYH
ncbi:MAG: hypothetical protein K2L45_04380 [Muribaculaceae bacterium]|nr:hypothetical protein [Muribaculaceae bacterium]